MEDTNKPSFIHINKSYRENLNQSVRNKEIQEYMKPLVKKETNEPDEVFLTNERGFERSVLRDRKWGYYLNYRIESFDGFLDFRDYGNGLCIISNDYKETFSYSHFLGKLSDQERLDFLLSNTQGNYYVFGDEFHLTNIVVTKNKHLKRVSKFLKMLDKHNYKNKYHK